ncbi:SUKH-3 domain-containing protein [Micromonospora olivasterospora]|uniref:SUKH-3 domain-containing protein n=1 Tax=Micromonospora olivasterospora TaxID=1880 RepID=UPI0011A876E9|nr:SUKH-3 domain-containing protein [Micromonospora olivasterospora]
MIDRRQAEQLATVWAQRDSQRLGHECVPLVEEFDLGYLITSTVAAAAAVPPGDLPTVVVDKETGEVSSWPRLPFPAVREMYRRSRPAQPVPRTVDPASQLLREVRRLPTPGVAAHLTVEGRVYVGRGAKGDVELRHHPLVRAYLDTLPPGRLARGGDRHAEVIVVSDVLHAYDHRRVTDGQPPLTLDDARVLFETSHLEVYRVREPGDPAGGLAERPCDSCVNFLVNFHTLDWSDLAYTLESRPEPQPPIHRGRFPEEVGHALMAGGWEDTMFNAAMAAGAIEDTCQVTGRLHRHQPFAAAEAALTAFPAIRPVRRGPGRLVWISRFHTNPTWAAHSADTLADFGAVINTRLFPIGAEDGDSIFAVDEQGRVFALDQAGEWFLGEDIDAALTTLLLGLAPPRVRDDGTW